ncbi:hypothetical protein Rhopal_003964-T1 [Rhodotorula paludigena]|uniref:Uncharacterized protein n=1 Tax=Rhodotorula paludigena TaxID=86838 RepID=A0AAV5GEJ5_9BASI|nr:hypothetical protein Rhopal_003964-T1 [Rhodotorula paludigena]
MRISSLLLLSAVPAALAQVTADLSASTSTDSDTTITLTRTRTATLTGSVVSESSMLASATSTSLGPRPTANITNGAEQQLRLWGPEGGLVHFTGPAVPKSCGVFVTNSSTYLQQIPLGGDYSTMTSGTFTWLIDVPAGLSLEVQMSIAGGVVGGLGGLALLILVIYLYFRYRARALAPPPPDGEKPYDPQYAEMGGPTYAQMVALNYAGSASEQQAQGGPQQFAKPSGFAAEAMPATPPRSPNHGGTPSEFGATSPRTQGTEGLDDPATFLSRSTMSNGARA